MIFIWAFLFASYWPFIDILTPETLGANVAFQVLNLNMIIAYITIFGKGLTATDREASVTEPATSARAAN
jgi:hypothetical protein